MRGCIDTAVRAAARARTSRCGAGVAAPRNSQPASPVAVAPPWLSPCSLSLSLGDELALGDTLSVPRGLAAGEGQGRKHVPVEVVIDVEVTGKAGACVLGLFPRAVVLTIDEKRA